MADAVIPPGVRGGGYAPSSPRRSVEWVWVDAPIGDREPTPLQAAFEEVAWETPFCVLGRSQCGESCRCALGCPLGLSLRNNVNGEVVE